MINFVGQTTCSTYQVAMHSNVLNVKTWMKTLANKPFCFYKSFQQRTTKDWTEAFDDSGIPCGPINNIKQVFDDPQVNELSH